MLVMFHSPDILTSSLCPNITKVCDLIAKPFMCYVCYASYHLCQHSYALSSLIQVFDTKAGMNMVICTKYI